MDTKLLLTKVVSLLFAETLLKTNDDEVVTLAKRVIGETQLPNPGSDLDFSREIVEGLLDTAGWLIESITSSTEVLYGDFLQRITINSQGEKYLVSAINSLFGKEPEIDKLEKYREQTLRDINDHWRAVEAERILTKARRQLQFERSKIDWTVFISNIQSGLEPLHRQGGTGSLEELGVFERINVADTEGINKKLGPNAAAEGEGGYVFKFGWQGLNRIFGANEGLRDDEMITISALSHNFKSGTMMNMFRQAAQYNVPPKMKDGKKPLLLHISYEPSTAMTYRTIYAQIMLNEQGICVDPKDVTANIDEVSALVKDRLRKNGWEVEFVRIDPDNSNFRQLFGLIEYYEKIGYKVMLVACDYLAKLNKEGCTQGAEGVAVKNLFSRARNYFNKKRIPFITAHQMSSAAAFLTRNGVTDQLVNEVAMKGYYDGCATLHQELDMELYCHIVEHNGFFYLTMRRGKHRVESITPFMHLYCAYRMAENNAPGFADDVNGVDKSMRRVGEDQKETSFMDSW